MNYHSGSVVSGSEHSRNGSIPGQLGPHMKQDSLMCMIEEGKVEHGIFA